MRAPAGLHPLPREDDIDENTSDCYQIHSGARPGRAREDPDERASSPRGLGLDQRARARHLRLRDEQPGATGLQAVYPGFPVCPLFPVDGDAEHAAVPP